MISPVAGLSTGNVLLAVTHWPSMICGFAEKIGIFELRCDGYGFRGGFRHGDAPWVVGDQVRRQTNTVQRLRVAAQP